MTVSLSFDDGIEIIFEREPRFSRARVQKTKLVHAQIVP